MLVRAVDCTVPPLSLYLSAHTKLCTLQLTGQAHSLYFYSTPICPLWGTPSRGGKRRPSICSQGKGRFLKNRFTYLSLLLVTISIKTLILRLGKRCLFLAGVFPARPSENNRVLENKYRWLLVGIFCIRFGGRMPLFLFIFIFFITYIHLFNHNIHPSPFAEASLHFLIACVLSGENFPVVPSREYTTLTIVLLYYYVIPKTLFTSHDIQTLMVLFTTTASIFILFFNNSAENSGSWNTWYEF